MNFISSQIPDKTITDPQIHKNQRGYIFKFSEKDTKELLLRSVDLFDYNQNYYT